MFNDCHIHTGSALDKIDVFLNRLEQAGISKAMLLSYHPDSFSIFGPDRPADRLKLLMEYAAACPEKIIPFYWIDPLDDDAFEQVDRALEANVRGFKVICNRHYPGDERPMQVWARIAKAGKPILFHSGILYANGPSSQYNRPANFEYLFDIPGLRFALAHVSWPWHDECLAVYGKWAYTKENGRTTSEMFIDATPGTPKIYREEVFSKIYKGGYNIEDNLLFGTDCVTDYDVNYANAILAMDKEALDSVGVTQEQRDKYYTTNFLRFVGE